MFDVYIEFWLLLWYDKNYKGAGFMKKIKISKKFIKIVVIVIIGLSVLNIAISGINIVPFEFRNVPVSFLTPDLDWCSRPSDVILKYGSPKEVSEKSDITGERDFCFNFVYEEKEVKFTAYNRTFLNNNFSTYYFYVDCKTPEEAEKFFNKCNEKILEVYSDKGISRSDGEDDDGKKEYLIWSGAVGIEFKISYTKDDPIVFITSHCQY